MLLAADLNTPSRFWLFEAVTSIHGHLLSCISKETEFVRELDLDDLPRQHQGERADRTRSPCPGHVTSHGSGSMRRRCSDTMGVDRFLRGGDLVGAVVEKVADALAGNESAFSGNESDAWLHPPYVRTHPAAVGAISPTRVR